ncbi:hypothetical protein SCHPADRAFT_924737 [Schizopora paradoxa]|uniref:Uncharacterized protein n=1 Tax=Schizopora paradoxa TaxID=27342 RepID=A0A0H2SPW5_9AGAM|nr:hypothetical protein SCHPADRAFT_924737 [Schizopora paradoxa]
MFAILRSENTGNKRSDYLILRFEIRTLNHIFDIMTSFRVGEPSTNSESASPFANTLPEILAKIFSYAIPMPHNLQEYIEYNSPLEKYPWPFLFVCKHWREVALSSPTLWSSIVLLPPNSHTGYTGDGKHGVSSYLSRLLDMHVKRSKNVPLTVVSVLSLSRTTLKPTFENLIKSQHRWRDALMNFMLNDQDITPVLPASGSESSRCVLRLRDLPLLESLSACCIYDEDAHEPLLKIELGPCPGLKQFKLFPGIFVRENEDVIHAEEDFLPNLRSVTIQVEDVDNGWQNLLQHSSAIELLEFRALGPDFSVYPTTAIGPFKLPNLRALEIQSAHVATVLQYFAFPSTTRLKLMDMEVRFSDGYLSDFSAVIKRMKLNIDHLELAFAFDDIPTFRSEILQEFLRLCNELRSLTLEGIPWNAFKLVCSTLTSAFNSQLELSESTNQESIELESTLLPKLHTLRVHIDLLDMTDAEAIDLACIYDLIFKCRERFPVFRLDLRILWLIADVGQSGDKILGLKASLQQSLDRLCLDHRVLSRSQDGFVICINGKELCAEESGFEHEASGGIELGSHFKQLQVQLGELEEEERTQA